MATLLDRPLGAILDVPDDHRSVNPTVEAFVARIAAVALEVARAAPLPAVAKAVASPSNAALVGALAELLSFAPSGNDLRTQALLRGRIALAELLEDSGGVWSAEEAMRHLKVTRTTLQNWRNQQRILALQHGDGPFVYPVAQFAPAATDLSRPRPYPGLVEVLHAAGDALTPEELVALLATPQEALATPTAGARTGFQALAAGQTEAVVSLVRHVVTPSDLGAPAQPAAAERA